MTTGWTPPKAVVPKGDSPELVAPLKRVKRWDKKGVDGDALPVREEIVLKHKTCPTGYSAEVKDNDFDFESEDSADPLQKLSKKAELADKQVLLANLRKQKVRAEILEAAESGKRIWKDISF